jgi:hypothetical protein
MEILPNPPLQRRGREGEGNFQMRKSTFILFLVLLSLSVIIFADAQGHFVPVGNTPTSCDFYGTVQISGVDIGVGDEVGAFDPDGVCCGSFTVHTTGNYGFLSVYGDDDTTPDVDEGAVSGDTITFRIWDAGEGKEYVAETMGPAAPVWTVDGRINVNLEEDYLVYLLGDINTDGEVDISDVILCLRMAIDLNPDNLLTADMNGDGVIDISDVILVLRKAIGLV